MIHSRDMIPKYLSENSKDIHIFLRLLDLVTNDSKLKSDDFINILNPDKCPNKLLPILASYLGYEYDYNETSDRNRVILRSYKNMIKNKGNTIGIQLAISASIAMLASKSIIDAQNLYDVAYYDKYYTCTNCNYISYSEFDVCPKCGAENSLKKNDTGSIVSIIEYPIYSAKSYDLIEAVRPAGTNLLLYNGTIETQVENLGISDFIKLQTTYLNAGTSEVGGKDSVSGFTPIIRESPNDFYYCEDCGGLFKSYTDERVCPYCGSQEVKLENNSSIRYLYRLYNTTKEYDNTVKTLVSGMSSGNIRNGDNCVGIVLRVHINHYDATDTKWNLNDFSQSFIFGIKPYISLGSNVEYCKYTIKDILDRIVSVNKTVLSTLQNKQKQGFTYKLLKQYANYTTTDVNKDNPVVLESSEDIDAIKSVLISSVANPQYNILYKMYYEFESTIDFVYFIYKDGNFVYTADDDGDLYVIKVTDTNADIVDDDTEIISYHNYELSKIEKSDDGHNFTEISPDSSELFDFSLGSTGDKDYTTYVSQDRYDSENNTVECESNDGKNYRITEHSENENEFISRDRNYIRVCGSCGTVIDNESAVVCPVCSGIKNYTYTSDNGVETVTQSVDPSILCGNYILDLYFD